MSSQLMFSLISVAVTIGGICIAFGVIKGKVDRVSEENKVQATKEELSAAIKHSDEMLEVLAKRVEEDRIGSERWRKEFLELARGHGERIAAFETMQANQTKILDKLEGAVNLGFKELREDLKELQRRMLPHG
jgi:translation initiation factor 2 alpha subunit (eIF-2alpha)